MQSQFQFFIQNWKGEMALAQAFWFVYILLGIIVFIIASSIGFFIVNEFIVLKTKVIIESDLKLYFELISTTLCVPYNIFSAICVWRCGKSAKPIWKILSRIVVIASIIFRAIVSLSQFFHI